MKNTLFVRCLTLSFLFVTPSFAQSTGSATGAKSAPKILTVITHESEPYMSQKMPGNGAVFAALAAVLKKQGYDLKVIFAPSWTRAKMDAISKSNIDGMVPVRAGEQDKRLVYSEYNFLSPWILVERKDSPLKWNKPEDLKGLKGGNVHGVELRGDASSLIAKKVISLETTSSYSHSFMQLAKKRVDFVFADPFVFNYTMATDPELASHKDNLQISAKPWFVEKYGIAFKKSIDPEVMKAIDNSWPEFNQHVEAYLKNVIIEAGTKAQSAKK